MAGRVTYAEAGMAIRAWRTGFRGGSSFEWTWDETTQSGSIILWSCFYFVRGVVFKRDGTIVERIISSHTTLRGAQIAAHGWMAACLAEIEKQAFSPGTVIACHRFFTDSEVTWDPENNRVVGRVGNCKEGSMPLPEFLLRELVKSNLWIYPKLDSNGNTITRALNTLPDPPAGVPPPPKSTTIPSRRDSQSSQGSEHSA